jgi:RNA polymerase sigma-70 factor (ECF subfamily)
MTSLIRSWTRKEENSRLEFEVLMERTYKQAYSLAYRMAGNGPDAEDLLQEAYVRAFRFFHKYDRNMPFTSWFFRIVTNVHIDNVRRKNRLRFISIEQQATESDRAWDLADEQCKVDANLLEGTLAEPIEKALSSMNPEFRTAVLLADVEGLSYEEIADVMNTSVGTVRSRVHRGRKQLRKNCVKEGFVPADLAAREAEGELV